MASATEEQEIRELTTTWFDAIENLQFDVIPDYLTPDVAIWQSTHQTIMDYDQCVEYLKLLPTVAKSFKYADRRNTVFPGGCVHQHVFEVVRADDGEKIRVPVCGVVWFRRCEDGKSKVYKLDEYIDSAGLTEITKGAQQNEE